jgi:hypothetical protein
MSGTNKTASGLNTLQRKAVKALIETDTITEAAKVAGCTRPTIYKYLENPVFRYELARLENIIRDASGRKLAKDSKKALDVIREIMDDPNQDARLRLRAAMAWFDYTLKTADTSELEERISALEVKFNDQ